jgi:hypothetical protein
MVVVGTLVTIMRLPGDARNLLWAEDGEVFLTQAYAHGYLHNVFTPYAGYMHLVPRTASQIVAALVPLREVGLGMNLSGALVWSLVAAAAYCFTRGRIRIELRYLLWLLVLLLPIGSLEVATNTANSHWFLMFGAFIVLSSRSETVPRVVCGALIVGAAMMSDPLTLIFAPLVVARVVVLRSLRENVVSIVFVCAAGVQLIVDSTTSRDRGAPIVDPLGLGRAYLIRIIWQTVTGPKVGTYLDSYAIGSRAVMILSASFLAALVTLIILKWPASGLAAVSLGASMTFFGMIGVLTWSNIGYPTVREEVIWGDRYLVVASLLLIVAMVSVANEWIPKDTVPASAVVRWVVLLAVACILLFPGVDNYRTPAFKAGNPQISQGIATAYPACRAAPHAFTSIPIGPAGWLAAVPCARVLDSR